MSRIHSTTSIPLNKNPPKTYKLLDMENSMGRHRNLAIQLLSIYKTSQIGPAFTRSSYQKIIDRIYQILRSNEWTCGSLIVNPSTKKMEILVNEGDTDKDLSGQVLEHINPACFDTKLEYEDRCKHFSEYKVGCPYESIEKKPGTNKNYVEFHIIRDVEDIKAVKNVAVMISVSHLVADGNTMYQLFNMLHQDSSGTAKNVYNLDRDAVEYNSHIPVQTRLAVKNGTPFWIAMRRHMILPFLVKSWCRSGNPKYHPYKIFNFRVNNSQIQKAKMAYQSRRTSSDPKFISTNDILTSWLFTKNQKADNVQIAVDMRPRLSNILKPDLAGNYLGTVLLNHDDLSAPEKIRHRVDKSLSKPPEDAADSDRYVTLPSFKQLLRYPKAVSTNWCKFYKKVELEGLELDFQIPLFVPQRAKVLGMDLLCEDNIIIFKSGDDEIGVVILTGSTKISKEQLEGDSMLSGRIM